MNILVISDSHGRIEPLIKIVHDVNPDIIFHLGDHNSDAEHLRKVFPLIQNIFSIAGNNDYEGSLTLVKYATVQGKKIMYCHGHTFSVRKNSNEILEMALKNNCDIALYGHTHIVENNIKSNVLILNPGSTYFPYDNSSPSYAILDTDNLTATIHHIT